MTTRIVLSCILAVIAVAALFLRFSYPVGVDDRWYCFGKLDPVYHLMGDQTADLGRVLRLLLSLVAVLGIVIVWL